MATHAMTVFFASCDAAGCGWQSPQKGTSAEAEKALASHTARRCRASRLARQQTQQPVQTQPGTYDGVNRHPRKVRK